MKSLKKFIISKSLKSIGLVSLLVGILAIKQSSTAMSQQPKCPDEFLE
ncbi:MAG: cyclic lactone autoinducer peptide [Bacillota bacterium]|nr:cyclic lactone autoinducer peptide [Bacillota bacterium]